MKSILTILTILLLSLSVNARELKVESFKLLSNDNSAVANPRIDFNGDTCALLKVNFPVSGCQFDGAIGDTDYTDGIYHLYLSPGVRKLNIKCPDHDNLLLDFGFFSDVKSLNSSDVYNLKLSSVDNSKVSDLDILEDDSRKLKVISMELLQTDISARTNERFDNNGNRCALVKLALPIPNCEFEETIGSSDFHINEYWVYISSEHPEFVLKCPGFSSFFIDTKCYSPTNEIIPGNTYKISLSGYDTSLIKFTDKVANIFKKYENIEAIISRKTGKTYGLYRFTKNGLKGVINIEGDEIIPCKYNSIYLAEGSDGKLLEVRKEGKENLINLEGKELLPWIYATCIYSNGLCVVGNYDEWGDETVGVVDLDGTEVIPCIYDGRGFYFTGESYIAGTKLFNLRGQKIQSSVGPLNNRFNIDDINIILSWQDDEYGNTQYKFLDKIGRRVNQYIYEDVPITWIDRMGMWRHFENGRLLVKRNNKFGYIDVNGQEIIPSIYDDASPFSDRDGDAMHYLNRDGFAMTYQNGVGLKIIDTNGRTLASFGPNFSIERATDMDIIINPIWYADAKVLKYNDCLFDENGQEILPLISQKRPANENLFKVQKNYKSGYMDRMGNIKVPFIYDECREFYDGVAAVCKNGKWGYIAPDGNEIIPCIYEDQYRKNFDFKNGLVQVKLNSKYGIINKRGETIIPCKYDKISDFSNGLVKVKLNSKYGIINKRGETIIPCKYDEISDFSNGLAEIEKNGKFGFVNIKGDEVWFGNQ